MAKGKVGRSLVGNTRGTTANIRSVSRSTTRGRAATYTPNKFHAQVFTTSLARARS